MSEGAKDNAPKVIKGQLPQEQREWIVDRLAEGLSPKYIVDQLIEDYPEYLEHAESNGYSKQQLVLRLRKRVYEFRQKRRPTSGAIAEKSENSKYAVLDPELLPDILDRNLSDETLDHFRDAVSDAIREYEPNADQSIRLKELNALLSAQARFENIFMKRIVTRLKLAEKIYLKYFSVKPEEDTQQVQAKEKSLPLGEYDWEDDSWLEGNEEGSNERED